MPLIEGKWIKSSRSNANAQCVEALLAGDVVIVRNSKFPTAGSAIFTGTEWSAFLEGAKDCDFDLPSGEQGS